ncbi:MAG: hypothetical protein WBX25_25645 [Rhodomicrobium sp.]
MDFVSDALADSRRFRMSANTMGRMPDTANDLTSGSKRGRSGERARAAKVSVLIKVKHELRGFRSVTRLWMWFHQWSRYPKHEPRRVVGEDEQATCSSVYHEPAVNSKVRN